ncbi:MAG: formate--phosphoribosylaminoimidazolecarboxamide ligase [Nitrososphaerales archaeon]
MVSQSIVLRLTSIATLGSHCALQVLKGAKDEGFKTLLVCENKRKSLYQRFRFIDELLLVNSFTEILDQSTLDLLQKNESILIPHGTLISNMDGKQIENIKLPFFGNRWILRWEADRNLKEKLMKEAGLETPKSIDGPNDIDRLVIVKLHGAAGGKGYFLAWDKKSFLERAEKLKKKELIKSENDLYIQEYSFGVPVYLQYFYSPLNDELEFLGIDRRYESDVDALGRVPSKHQQEVEIEPSYTVIGNIPLVLRESLLEKVYNMGERFVQASKRLVKPGMLGPFCIEGVYDKDGKFTSFEFSARIVAGTNLYVEGSPYSAFIYDEPMSMGRRIAREIKDAQSRDILDKVIT